MTYKVLVDHDDILRRQIRILILLNSAENAGITPISVSHFHMLAYFSNVLSPIWNAIPLDGKILKREDGPFYPSLQVDLDRLVGIGVVGISKISHTQDKHGRWRLDGQYQLNPQLSKPILEKIQALHWEAEINHFIQEIAYAFSSMVELDKSIIANEDATYADPIIDFGNVVDFGEWKNENYSFNAAAFFESFFPANTRVARGELLHLYVRHLQRRLHGEQF